ncbi:hypothetical protein GDO81_021596 [Engystomops pustulosus]|uniref:Uncharacterized protein n=1 Tax=Engystomops pustulosus TaxID=76066 RepID=A0AAV6YUZ9_ENGPU|nr:hypothetical protein GDO81_021596 [Engystomops pustulosus]
MTLSFSDEEWLGLDPWQRELYRTVMRDTMELVTSIESEFFKVIKVEELEVMESEAMKERYEREIHPEEQGDLQGEAMLPDPHITSSYHLPWTEDQKLRSLGTMQWSEQTMAGSGWCEEEGEGWWTLADQQISTQESLYTESSYECSFCSRIFTGTPDFNHRGRLQIDEGTFSCPSCYRHQQDSPQLTLSTLLHTDKQTGLSYSTTKSLKEKPHFSCPQCDHSFTQLIGLQHHQKTHAHTKASARETVSPLQKVFRVPVLHPMEDREVNYTEGAYSKLHQNLQLSTAFLQQLISSTCGFQYD